MITKEAIITGASGHIGNRLANFLLEKNYKLTLFLRRESEISEFLKSKGAKIHICNFNDENSYKDLLNPNCVVFHLASENTISTSNAKATINNTYGLTKSFITTCLKVKVKKIIYTSSVVVLGRSKNVNHFITINDSETDKNIPYVAGKIEAENWILKKVNSETDIRIVYPSWVVGNGYLKKTPPQEFVHSLAKENKFLCIKGGVSLTHVDDVANGIIKVCENGSKNGRYILSGHNISFERLFKEIKERFNKPKSIILPTKLLKLIIKILGKYSPIDNAYAQKVIGSYSWYKCPESLKIGYKIRPIKEIIDDIEIDIRREELRLNIFQYLPITKNTNATKKYNLLITGFPGWLGNRMLEKIIKNENIGISRDFSKIKLLVQKKFIKYLPKLPDYFQIIEGDLSNLKSIEFALNEIDCVWHIAGTVYPSFKNMHYEVNLKGTENVAKACIKKNVRRIIYMSTDSVFGYASKENKFFTLKQKQKPYKDYGYSKFLAENLLMRYSANDLLDVTIFRGFWFFGPNMPERNKKFLKSFFWPRQIVFGNGLNYRSITHIDDIFNAFVKATKSSKSFGKSYWITTLTKTRNVNQIYQLISNSLNKKFKPVYIPNFVCEIISYFDSAYTFFTGRINSTTLAAGKFHKNIAIKKSGLNPNKIDFNWESDVSLKQIKDELHYQAYGKNSK